MHGMHVILGETGASVFVLWNCAQLSIVASAARAASHGEYLFRRFMKPVSSSANIACRLSTLVTRMLQTSESWLFKLQQQCFSCLSFCTLSNRLVPVIRRFLPLSVECSGKVQVQGNTLGCSHSIFRHIAKSKANPSMSWKPFDL